MKGGKKWITLWLMCLLYFGCCLVKEIDVWMVLSIWSTGLSIYLLIKLKLPSKKWAVWSVVLAGLVSVAYPGIQPDIRVFAMNGVMNGIPTFLCSLAVCSVMEKCGRIKVCPAGRKWSLSASMMLAAAVAAVLLCILFGIPFTTLQWNKDLVCAMVSHGLVDAVRFAVFGFS